MRNRDRAQDRYQTRKKTKKTACITNVGTHTIDSFCNDLNRNSSNAIHTYTHNISDRHGTCNNNNNNKQKN